LIWAGVSGGNIGENVTFDSGSYHERKFVYLHAAVIEECLPAGEFCEPAQFGRGGGDLAADF
jgi:hypothetical protein